MSTRRLSSDGAAFSVQGRGLVAFKIHDAARMELGYEGRRLPVDVRLAHPPPSVLVARPDLPGDVPVRVIIVALRLHEEAGSELERRLASTHLCLSFLSEVWRGSSISLGEESLPHL